MSIKEKLQVMQEVEKRNDARIKEYYKECQRLYGQVNWDSRESIHMYNEMRREMRKMYEEQ